MWRVCVKSESSFCRALGTQLVRTFNTLYWALKVYYCTVYYVTSHDTCNYHVTSHDMSNHHVTSHDMCVIIM